MERFGQIVSIGDTTVLYCFGFDLFWDSFNILSLTVSSRFPHKFDKFEVDLDDADVNGQGLRHSLKNQVMAACHGRTCSATSFSRSYLFTHIWNIYYILYIYIYIIYIYIICIYV